MPGVPGVPVSPADVCAEAARKWHPVGMTSVAWCSGRGARACAHGVLWVLLLAAPGCKGGGGSPDAGDGGDASRADLGMPGPSTTYFARHDGRRCAAPGCGGYFLQAVNKADTLCADGTRAEECYVADLDWTPSALTPSDQTRATGATGGFLLDGQISSRAYGGSGVFGVLLVESAWVAEWGTPLTVPTDAPLHGLARTALLCLIDPCFNIRMDTLGTATTLMISGLDVSAVGASGPEQALAASALEAGTLRATGSVMTDAVAGPGGFGETYHAQQFYLRLPLDAPP